MEENNHVEQVNVQQPAPDQTSVPNQVQEVPEVVKIEEKENKPEVTNIVSETSKYDGTFWQFHGYNYLRKWITAITLTVGKPFGDHFYYTFDYGHTVINNKRLKYDGQNHELFVEQFKWTFLTVITFGIYGWVVPLRRLQYVTSHTHFEDDELIDGNSYFDGGLWGLIGINILCMAITLITLGLGYPFALCLKEGWIQKHKVISGKRLKFTGIGLQLLGNWIKWFFLSIITLGIYALWVGLKKKQWIAKRLTFSDENVNNSDSKLIIPAIIVAVVFFIISIALIPYISDLINETMSQKNNYQNNLIYEDYTQQYPQNNNEVYGIWR